MVALAHMAALAHVVGRRCTWWSLLLPSPCADRECITGVWEMCFHSWTDMKKHCGQWHPPV